MKTWRPMNTMTFPVRCSTGSGEIFAELRRDVDGLEQSDDEIEMESSVADAESAIRDEEFRWQRVEKLCEDVKQFGEEMIDDGSLASIYDFRIDKFQVHWI
ncbi:DExH-box ATP-dependent RNA helicase DExH15 chloroplastic-like [Rosa sericea]